MKKREPEVIRSADGKVTKIIYNNFGKPIIHEVANSELKRVDKDGPSLSAEEYAKIKKQMMGILRGKKKNKKIPTHRKKSQQFLIDEKEAYAIHAKIEDYRLRHKNASYSEAMKEVLRQEEQTEIAAGLHKWREHFLAAGIKFLGNGWVALSFWVEGTKRKVKRWKGLMDIFSAIRSQEHTADFYTAPDGEQKKIFTIKEVLGETNTLLTAWLKTNKAERANVGKKLFATLKLLDGCHNEYKKQVLEQLETIIGFRDNLGRINPGAMAAKTITTLVLIYRRSEEAEIIPAKTILRKKMLEWEKERLDVLFTFCAGQINLFSKHQAFFKGQLTATQATILDNKIKQIIEILNTAFSSPYWERSNAAKERLVIAQKALRSHNMAKARVNLLDARNCLTPLPVDLKKEVAA
jgi:hypothetical protein